MAIKTERLNIYPASEKQMEAFIAVQSAEVLKAAYSEMLDGALTHPEQWEWYAMWMIELKDGTHIGEMCFKGLETDGTAEIGYGINGGYEGQGFMTEAVSAVVKWASVQKGVKLIKAETEDSNAASKRVLEKSGFIPTGKRGSEGPIYVWKGR